MSDHNATPFTAATTSDNESNLEANKTSGNDCVSGDDPSMLMNSFGVNLDNDDKNDDKMRTIDEEKPSEFDDPLREEEMNMKMMDEYSEAVVADKDSTSNDASSNTSNGNFGVSYSDDILMMDSNSNSNSNSNGNSNGSRHNHGSHGKSGLRIDSSSSSSALGEAAAPSWFAAVKHAATKPSTPTTSNLTNDNGGKHQEGNGFEKEGRQESEQQQQQQEDISSESTEMMQDISAKLDDKLNNTRLLAKRLLQEMTIYVQSLETVANEYGRIRESELRESQRLDAVEPEVNGASGMLLASAGAGNGDGGEGFFVTSDTGARQPSPPLVGQGLGHRYKRHCHSSPKELQLQQDSRSTTRPLTPTVGNRRSSSNNGRDGGTGKENYDSLRPSFA
jgi:hypothetical protein